MTSVENMVIGAIALTVLGGAVVGPIAFFAQPSAVREAIAGYVMMGIGLLAIAFVGFLIICSFVTAAQAVLRKLRPADSRDEPEAT